MSDLEMRLKRLEDRIELQDLVVRYAIAADDDEYDTLENSFAKHGTFSGPGFSGGSNREEVMDFVRTFRMNMGPTIHTPDFALFSFQSADQATGVVGAHIEFSCAGQTLFGAFRYYDEYIREDGQWRFASRRLLTIHVGPWDDIGTSLTDEHNIRWPGSEPTKSHLPKKR